MTWLFQSGMPEKLVCDTCTTGHRSTTAVREYQRNNKSVEHSISSVVQGCVNEENEDKKRVCTKTCTPENPGFSVEASDSMKFTLNVSIQCKCTDKIDNFLCTSK